MFRRVIANGGADCKPSPQVEQILRDEIARGGPVPCSRFMEVALYQPEHGYYERDRSVVGQRGDFYTSVSVGPLFGQMLGFQFAGWIEEIGGRQPATCNLQIVEAGAHDGQLAEDILNWLQRHRPDLAACIEYWILDPSVRRQEWQRERLSMFAPRVRWFASWAEIQQAGGVRGVIFANELLDVFPVHRVAWSAADQRWFEWGVRTVGERFIWTRLPALHLNVAALMQPGAALSNLDEGLRASAWASLAPLLPDGFILEIAPFAELWWELAAQSLRQGKLLTFDYGHATGDVINPSKPHGTLRAYRDHHQVDDILAAPGTQDITAHVNFAVVQHAGERAGLATVELTEQARFLTRIAQRTMQQPAAFGEWHGERVRQFQTLSHPDHLGRSFSVLVQERV
ncbi:MAG: SAM-dependent methyltransferase [Verrucomicrobia bacterium]|nr:SAM-dependent methyltransferase [Verrucomicrobiota bacterium]